jgi:integrase
MARVIGRLTALKVSRGAEPGMYADGGGLYLQVTGTGAKSWIYRYMLRGREREMGLGSLSAVCLADARAKAAECRSLRQAGVDPIDRRKKAKDEARLDAASALTFKSAVIAYIDSHRAGWRNPKHIWQWGATLAKYASPIIGDLSVQAIDTTLVLKVLEPIWPTIPETASRLRGRIEAVLDWATVRGYRKGDNPARWRGHLSKLLPARSKVRKVRHHTALPYAELPDFMVALSGQRGIAARTLEFTILTAARTGEAIGATWGEVSEAEKVWIVPGNRMKAGKEHRVPLSNPVLAIFKEMKSSGNGELVFHGAKRGRPLSNTAMIAVLRRMGRGDLTVHGFRSSFRDWVAERTNFPGEMAEMALAHAVGDRVEAAYRRGDMFDRRRRLMSAWAAYCANGKGASEVVSISHAKAKMKRKSG